MGDRESQGAALGQVGELPYGGRALEKDPVYVLGCCEEEEEDDHSDVKHSCLLLRHIFRIFFPDRQILTGFIINAAIILIYALFNLNAYTIGIDVKTDARDDTVNTLWSMSFVFLGNMALYFTTMILRFILVKCVFQFICPLNAHLFALFSMLDPHIFYVVWSSTQSLIWQVLLTRPKADPKLYCIETYFWPNLTANRFTFGEESLLWISCTIYLHIILSLRSLALSIISFLFELNLLLNSNEALKKYLKLYSSIMKFNINWLTFVMSNQELMRKLKSIFANRRIRAKLFPRLQNKTVNTMDFKSKHGLQVLNESHNANYLQYFSTIEGISIPSEVTDSLVEQSSTSSFSNWLLIYYVIRVPPVLSLLHQEVMLKEDSLIAEAAAILFEHMYITVTKLKPKQREKENYAPSFIPSSLSFNRQNSYCSDVENAGTSTEAGNEQQEQEKPNQGNADYVISVDNNAGRESQETAKVHITRLSTNPSRARMKNNRAVSLLSLQNFRKTIENMEVIPDEGQVPDNTNILTPDYQYNQKKGDDARFLSKEQLRYFLAAEDCDSIMNLLDLSGHGRINLSMLQQALMNLYSTRKKFKSNVKGQDSIFKVLSRLLSAASWLVAVVTMAFLAGITPEAVVVSGAALLSAITVALSYLYTNFLTSVIFVAFSNPYNVGDRVRLNDGEPLTVRKIRTYTTEFVTILGKVMVYQNATLATQKITNESRASRATIDIQFKLDASVTEENLHRIQNQITATCNALPNDFVKDSVWMFLGEFNPGHCFLVSIWVTCIESWANWQRIFQLKGDIMELVVRECKLMGVSYSLPVQPMAFTHQLTVSNVTKKEFPPPGKRP